MITPRNVSQQVRCFTHGCLTRASLMVNGRSVAYAVGLAKAINLPIGLHVNLTEGSPILHFGSREAEDSQQAEVCAATESQEAPASVQSNMAPPSFQMNSSGLSSSLAPDGAFLGKHAFRVAWLSGGIRPDDLKAEIAAQAKRFVQLTGHAPEYIDGHQHVHVLPGIPSILVSAVLEACTGQLPPPLVRLPLPPPGHDQPPSNPCASITPTGTATAAAEGNAQQVSIGSASLALRDDLSREDFHSLVQEYALEARQVFVEAGWRVPAAFIGFDTMGSSCSLVAIHASIDAARRCHALYDTAQGIIEVMTHPGAPVPVDEAHLWGCGDAGADVFSQSLERKFEAEQLQSCGKTPPWLAVSQEQMADSQQA